MHAGASSSLGQSLRRDHVRSAVDIALNNGMAPQSLASLKDLVAPEVVRTIFRAFHKKSEARPSHLALMMAKTLISIAREWVKASPEHIDELKRLRSKLPGLEPGLSKKNKQVLIKLDDPGVLEPCSICPKFRLRARSAGSWK